MMQKALNSILFVLLFFTSGLDISAQESRAKEDIEFINASLSRKQSDPFKRPYIYKGEKSLVKKLNPVNLLAGGSLFFYQNVLSKHISADCLYTPSCSEFSKQAIRDEGLLKGILLTADRLNRCNRIAAIDLKRYRPDAKTNSYPDPVSRYKKSSFYHEK